MQGHRRTCLKLALQSSAHFLCKVRYEMVYSGCIESRPTSKLEFVVS
jgi:hypothetical protein